MARLEGRKGQYDFDDSFKISNVYSRSVVKMFNGSVYLGHIKGISLAYLGISWAFLRHTLGIPRHTSKCSFGAHILDISRAYIGHSMGIS